MVVTMLNRLSLNVLLNNNVKTGSLTLLIGLALVLIPHFTHLPLWLCVVTSLLIMWRFCFELKMCPIPGKKVLFLLTLMMLVGILFSYQTLIGRNAGSAMLLGLLCLKLFEIKSFRDVSLIIYLALFSIVINFLFSQSIPVALTMLFALVFLFSALVSFQHNYKHLATSNHITLDTIKKNEKQHFKLAIKMLTQAVPFAIVLFILFPRVNGPLWGLPEDAFSATSGLSDKMSPGRISNLSDNNEVAFRVQFQSDIPATEKLYWRGPVMWNFDGYNWTAPSNERMAMRSYQFSAFGDITRYSITLQPHNKYWMFALDMPSVLPANSFFSADMQVLAKNPIDKLVKYTLESYTQYILPAYSANTMQRYLKLPASNFNSENAALYKSYTLMKKLSIPSNPEQTIQNVLNYFATQDFYYTRQPPLLYDNPVDEFLFDSKRGYCEHYASSFTVLMRLAGIPARVVTGYQGGEINPINQFMIIRQSDAHAWSEVYLGDKGWVRIDPTAAIPPGNIENTADARRLNSTAEKSSAIFKTTWLSQQIKQMRFALDAVNNKWNQWVLGYDTKKQKALFNALGVEEISWQGLSQLLFLILGILGVILAITVSKNNVAAKNEVQRYYLKYLKKLKTKGLDKANTEGAADFCQRAAALLPQHKESLERITQLYQQLRYKPDQDQKKKLIQFKHLVSSIKLSH